MKRADDEESNPRQSKTAAKRHEGDSPEIASPEVIHQNDSQPEAVLSISSSDEKVSVADPSDEDRKIRCCLRWPRLCVVIFGLVVPLWVLIILSVVLGSWLSVLELPHESKFYMFTKHALERTH